MRKGVSRNEVFRLWASQTQDEATEKNGGRTFFEKRICYSYGRHFPIAKIEDNGNCLFTLRAFSNTTSTHIHKARYAANNRGLNVIYCYDIESQSRSIAHWENKIYSLLGELANKRNRNLDGRISDIRHNIHQLETYCQYFNIILDFKLVTIVAFAKEDNLVERVRMNAVA